MQWGKRYEIGEKREEKGVCSEVRGMRLERRERRRVCTVG